MVVKLDQLLHGYRKGHEQLAGSLKLDDADSELVTRLSDLSGSQSGCPPFESYLTFYPLPSGKAFAIAKTWPDPDAPRAGCVLTHTLLLPLSLWESIESPRRLSECFSQRPARNETNGFTGHVLFAGPTDSVGPMMSADTDIARWVRLFLGEGRRPIAWFNHDQPEPLLWALVEAMWPKLRSTFSACTYSLAPRYLEDRTFDLLLAPGAAHSRFLKISPESFIDSASRKGPLEVQDWERFWANIVATGENLLRSRADFWSQLAPDPALAKRLYLLDASFEDPTGQKLPEVQVGAIDLIESMAKEPRDAARTKLHAVQRALFAASNSDAQAEWLRLIGDRLLRPSFNSVANQVGPFVASAVQKLAMADFQQFAEVWMESTPSIQSWFSQGMLGALRQCLISSPDQLAILRRRPQLLEAILEVDSELALSVIAAALQSSSPDDWDFGAIVSSALASKDSNYARLKLLAAAALNKPILLEQLLRDVDADEVAPVLSVILSRCDYHPDLDVEKVISSAVASRWPRETRDALIDTELGPDLWRLFVSTVPASASGLELLVDQLSGRHSAKVGEIVAAYISYHNLYDHRQSLDVLTGHKALMTMLSSPEPASDNLVRMVERLLNAAVLVDVAPTPSDLELVATCRGRPYFPKLIHSAVGWALFSFQSGSISEQELTKFVTRDVALAWAKNASGWDLVEVITFGASRSWTNWKRTWAFLGIAPAEWIRTIGRRLPEMVDRLIGYDRASWNLEIDQSWRNFLVSSESVLDSHVYLTLCAQALKHCFSNLYLPFGNTISTAFLPVYLSVMRSRNTPSEVVHLFGFFDWDKGLELRKKLVDSFTQSKWPKGNLILAAGDEVLLRKVFKRLIGHRYGGERFAREALSDLEARGEHSARRLMDAWKSMLGNPDFHEDWI